jgi:hypothetical protein
MLLSGGCLTTVAEAYHKREPLCACEDADLKLAIEAALEIERPKPALAST